MASLQSASYEAMRWTLFRSAINSRCGYGSYFDQNRCYVIVAPDGSSALYIDGRRVVRIEKPDAVYKNF